MSGSTRGEAVDEHADVESVSSDSGSYTTMFSENELATHLESLALEESPGGTAASPHALPSADPSPKEHNVVGTFAPGGVIHHHLDSLRDTTRIEMRPGLEPSGVILFVLTSRESVSHCKKAGTYLDITDFDDGAIRFTMSNAADLPVTVSTSNGSVGSVHYANGCEYDLDINYHIYATSGTAITRYEVKQRGKDIGEIYVSPGQMTFTFQIHIPAEIKALTIAYGIHRALLVHRVDVVDTKQSQLAYNQSFHMLYENVFPLMESCVLKAVSRMPDGNGCAFALIDATNRKKVLMLIKCDQVSNEMQAFDVRGNELFRANGLKFLTDSMQVMHRNQLIGEVKQGKVNDKATMSTSTGIHLQCMQQNLAGGTAKYIFTDANQINLAVVSNVESFDPTTLHIKIMLLRGLQTIVKRLIMGQAIRISHNFYRIQRVNLPKVIISKPLTTATDYPSIRYCPLPIIPTLAALSSATKFLIRAAGYHKLSQTQYYDVINSSNENVIISLEFKPDEQIKGRGKMVANDNKGGLLFAVPDLLEDDMLSMYLPNGDLAAYHSGSNFYSSGGKTLMAMTSRLYPGANEDRWGPNWVYHFRKPTETLASINRRDVAIEVAIFNNIKYVVTDLDKALIIAMAMRLNYKIYKFHERFLPPIEYTYLDTYEQRIV